MAQPRHCQFCGREFAYGNVLFGFEPCKCGGHMYAYSREDKQGCGATTYIPPMRATCRRIRFGYEGTS